jgi:hypothetical protein
MTQANRSDSNRTHRGDLKRRTSTIGAMRSCLGELSVIADRDDGPEFIVRALGD